MNHPRKIGLLACLALAAGLIVTRAEGQKTQTRSEFMRTKLELSQRVLEGLTIEDYGMIAKGARGLKLLSQAAEWQVPTIPNATEYIVYTNEFQRLTDELTQKARNKNIDGATLTYFRLTVCCVNCHKYVRSLTR